MDSKPHPDGRWATRELARQRSLAYRDRADTLVKHAHSLAPSSERKVLLKAATQWLRLAEMQERIAR